MLLNPRQEAMLKAAFLRKRPDDTFADDEYITYLRQCAAADSSDPFPSDEPVAARVTVRVTNLNPLEASCHLCPNLPLYTYEMRRGSESWRIPLCETHIQKKNVTLRALFPKTTSHLPLE